MDIYEKLKLIVADAYGVDIHTITPNTHFVYDLDDSMEIIEVVMACEEAFGITISDDEAQTFATVGEMAAFIERKLRDRK